MASGRDGDEVWVAVSNEGGPLDAAAARLLFEPFTQGDTGATRAHEGLGMGLYVVRRLVEVYGGWVAVRSRGRLGHGRGAAGPASWRRACRALSHEPQEPTAGTDRPADQVGDGGRRPPSTSWRTPA